MKFKKIYTPILFVAILILINGKGFTQGTGNHITMSLENCSYPASNIIQFDLMIMSDGVSSSELRLASVSYGINFNTCILQSGATITPTIFAGPDTNLFPAGFTPAFTFLTSIFPYHIRLTTNAYTGTNNGSTMVVGHQYRVCSVQLTCSANYTNCCPDFSLQDTTAGGKTNTGALVFIGLSSNTSQTSFFVTGTGDGRRSVYVSSNCACINGVNENTFEKAISIFPNPARGKLNLILPNNISGAEIKIFNILGKEQHFSTISGHEAEIDISGLTNDVYFVQIKAGNTIGRAKFVKL